MLLHTLFGKLVPPHPILHLPIFYLVSCYLSFKTKNNYHLLFSTIPDSPEANLSKLTQNFVHNHIITFMALSYDHCNVCVCVRERERESVHMLSRSVLSDSATPWTVACQALCPWNFPGKNTGVGCHLFLPPGTLPDPGSNPHFLHLLHWQADSLPLSHLRSPIVMFAYVLISPSSQ